jgi:hypothetical protein
VVGGGAGAEVGGGGAGDEVGGGVVGAGALTTVAAAGRGSNEVWHLPAFPSRDTCTVITTATPGVASPTRNRSIRVPRALAWLAMLSPVANVRGPVAVTRARATVRTRTFTMVWSAGRLLTAWTLHASEADRTVVVPAGRGEGFARVELALVEPVPFVAASMMTNKTKIAINADHMGCR